MPRPQEFDTDAAIAAATNTFWRRGYESTSVDALVRAMGINRSSLYNAFGDKQNVFARALDYYDETVVSDLLGEMEREEGGLEAIERYLRRIAEYHASPEGRRGCLMTNSATSSACGIREVRSRVRSHVRRLERAFLRALERAKKRGEISASAPVAKLARFLATFVQGMQVIAKARPERAFLDDIVNVGLSSIRRIA